MEAERCARCKSPIEGEGVEFVGRIFCSDACCEQFEDFVAATGEPIPDDLDEALDVGDDEDVLEDLEELDDLDDDFVSDDDDYAADSAVNGF